MTDKRFDDDWTARLDKADERENARHPTDTPTTYERPMDTPTAYAGVFALGVGAMLAVIAVKAAVIYVILALCGLTGGTAITAAIVLAFLSGFIF